MDNLRGFSKLILTGWDQHHLKILSIRVLTLALFPLDPFHRARSQPKAHFLPLRPQRTPELPPQTRPAWLSSPGGSS